MKKKSLRFLSAVGAAVFAFSTIAAPLKAFAGGNFNTLKNSNFIEYYGSWDRNANPEKRTNANFTSAVIEVDGKLDEAYETAEVSRIENVKFKNQASYGNEDVTYGELRTLWDGPVLYAAVSVYDGDVVFDAAKTVKGAQTSQSKLTGVAYDSIVLGFDLYNDRTNYETDVAGAILINPDGTYAYFRNSNIPSLSSPLGDPNHPEYMNVIKAIGGDYMYDEDEKPIGYVIEIALQIEGVKPSNGTEFGLELKINDINRPVTRYEQVKNPDYVEPAVTEDPEGTPGADGDAQTPAPAEAPAAAPGEATEGAPAAAPAEAPAEAPEEAPAAAPAEAPEGTPAAAPEETPAATPAAAPEETPAATPGETPAANTSEENENTGNGEETSAPQNTASVEDTEGTGDGENKEDADAEDTDDADADAAEGKGNDDTDGEDGAEGEGNDDADADATEGEGNDDADGDEAEGEGNDDADADATEGEGNDDADGDDAEGEGNEDADADATEGEGNDAIDGDEAEGDDEPDAEEDDAEEIPEFITVPVREGSAAKSADIFWSHNQDSLYTDFDHEHARSYDWGVVTLAGWNGTDEFAYSEYRITRLIDFMNSASFPKGVYTEASQAALDAALERAQTVMQFKNKMLTDEAADILEAAFFGLKWGDTRYPDPSDLPRQNTLPNIYSFFGSDRVVKNAEDWEERRAEILNLAQFYEYGFKPGAPDNAEYSVDFHKAGDPIHRWSSSSNKWVDYEYAMVNGSYVKVYTYSASKATVTMKLTVGSVTKDINFDITYPTDEQLANSGNTGKEIPIVLSFDGAIAAYLNQGIAVVSLPTVVTDTRTNSYAWGKRTGAFYELYPYHRNGVAALNEVSNEMAEAWAATRVIDALEALKASSDESVARSMETLDPTKLAVTGFSINGKYAFVSAVFDDRIDVCIPGAAGATGPSPWRYVYRGQEYDWSGTAYDSSGVDSYQIASGTEVIANSVRHNRVRETELFRHFMNFGHFYEFEDGAYGYATRLPFDQSDLVATLASGGRAIVIENTVNDYNDGCTADCLGAEIAKSVYRNLGYDADKYVKFNLRGLKTGDPHGSDTAQRTRSAEYLNYYFFGTQMSEETAGYLGTDPYALKISNNKTESPYDYYWGGYNTITGGTGGVDGRDGWYYYTFPTPVDTGNNPGGEGTGTQSGTGSESSAGTGETSNQPAGDTTPAAPVTETPGRITVAPSNPPAAGTTVENTQEQQNTEEQDVPDENAPLSDAPSETKEETKDTSPENVQTPEDNKDDKNTNAETETITDDETALAAKPDAFPGIMTKAGIVFVIAALAIAAIYIAYSIKKSKNQE
ncbi:MAG: hypothetical protein K5796_11290 [Lachnospiraceae bacterium]|nr:hypothetical protein [Lachnospiraceae bacterium]